MFHAGEQSIRILGKSARTWPDTFSVFQWIRNNDILIYRMTAFVYSVEDDSFVGDFRWALAQTASQSDAGIAQWQKKLLEIDADGMKDPRSDNCGPMPIVRISHVA